MPGKAGSDYMVFGLKFLEDAQIDNALLSQIRLVAYASNGYVDQDASAESPIKTYVEKFNDRRMSQFSKRLVHCKVRRNVVTIKGEFPLLTTDQE